MINMINQDNQFSKNKILFFKEQVMNALEKRHVNPIVFELSLSGCCNQKCIYCCCDYYHKKEYLNFDQINNIIEQVSYCAKAITLTGGGEPTLNPWFSYTVEHIKKRGLSVGVISNGTNLDLLALEVLAKYASFFRVSLDSTDSAMYEKIRRPYTIYSLDTVLSNINSIVKLKRKYKSELQVGVQIVLCGQSISDIKKTILAVRSLGVDFIQIRPEDNATGKSSEPQYEYIKKIISERENLEKFSTEVFKVFLSYNKLNEYERNSVYKSYIGCSGANFTCSIGHNNRVYFCCSNIGNEKYELGNLENTSLKEILISTKRKKLIEECDHEGCQMQCRNHELNKLFYNLERMDKEEINRFLEQISNTTPPMHCEFL